MPLYEYQCQSCEKVTEVIQSFSAAPLRKCETCGGRLTKLISRGGFVLKGGGWYSDSYQKPSTPGGTDSAPPSGSDTAAPAAAGTEAPAAPKGDAAGAPKADAAGSTKANAAGSTKAPATADKKRPGKGSSKP